MLNPQQTAHLKNLDRSGRLYEWARSVEAAINGLSKQTGVDPSGIFPQTPNIASLSVTAGNGMFNVQITDNSQINTPASAARPISYFAEFATDSGFVNIVHSEHMGPFRNKNVFLGNQTLYVRAFSQLFGSAPSSPVVYGSPTAVTGGGVAAPTQQGYQGSGSSATGGSGYGLPTRSAGRSLS